MLTYIEPRSPEWHAKRLRNIGGSEIAALVGDGSQASYASTRYELFHVKSGKVPAQEIDGDRLRAGRFMEPAIAAMAAEQEGWTIVPGRYAEDDDCPGLGASLDYEITHPSAKVLEKLPGVKGPGACECKSVDYIQFKRTWGNGEPPLYHLLQLQAQLAASGFEWGCLAGLVGGNDLKLYYYRRREPSIALVREVVTTFWEQVRGNNAPAPDGSDGATYVIRNLFPELEYDPADLRASEEAAQLAHTIMQRQADEKEAKAAKDDARNKLMVLIGPKRKAMIRGFNATISVTEAKPARNPPPGYMIPGRAESRRLTITERVVTEE